MALTWREKHLVFINTRCMLDLSHNFSNSDSLLADSLSLSRGGLSPQTITCWKRNRSASFCIIYSGTEFLLAQTEGYSTAVAYSFLRKNISYFRFGDLQRERGFVHKRYSLFHWKQSFPVWRWKVLSAFIIFWQCHSEAVLLNLNFILHVALSTSRFCDILHTKRTGSIWLNLPMAQFPPCGLVRMRQENSLGW